MRQKGCALCGQDIMPEHGSWCVECVEEFGDDSWVSRESQDPPPVEPSPVASYGCLVIIGLTIILGWVMS